MADKVLEGVLLVDDEPNVVSSLKRHLRGRYAVTTAGGGAEALDVLRGGQPFSVIVSDLRMPGMDGVALLKTVRAEFPDTVRMLLSGQADLDSAIAVINEGSVFRFLTKPCPPPTLLQSLADAVKQYHLLTAERVLLEQTLRGCISAMTEILSLANPVAFGRATRIRRLVMELAEAAAIENRWECEVAAMLSQIGCVTLPAQVVEKLYHGRPLTEDERVMSERLGGLAEKVLANIPRIDGVRQILSQASQRFDGAGKAALSWGARALRLALDFDSLEASGLEATVILDRLRTRQGLYDPALIAQLAELRGGASAGEVREIEIHELDTGMVFAADVLTASGMLLVARGQEVTASLLERLRNLPERMRVDGRVHVSTGQVLAACSG